jgi:hypothetical protein
MRKLLAILAFLACAAAARGQTISVQPVSQAVQVGAIPTFTVAVTLGPCRSYWTIGGVGHYGSLASTVSYSLPPATLAMNGWTVQVQMYACSGGSVDLTSNIVTLTVTPAITLTSLAIPTTAPIIGIGQPDLLTAIGTYSDGSTQNLTLTSTWTSSAPTVASIANGSVLGLALGSTSITASTGDFTASTGLTVEPSLGVTFTPSNEDGSAPAASLVISQIVTNADSTTTSTPVLTLPDPTGATSGSLLYNSALLYSATFFLNQNPVGQPLVFSPTLMTAVQPAIKSESLVVVLCVTSCAAGAVKSMSWSSQ